MRMCYNGFGRGILAELLHLIGVVSATALACNYREPLAELIAPWWPFDPSLVGLVSFLLIFLSLMLLVVYLGRKAAERIIGEHIPWFLRWVGLMLGGMRGVWWSGVVVLLVMALGVPYLTWSVSKRSVVGPRLARLAHEGISMVADRYPGSGRRADLELIPQASLRLPKILPAPKEQESWRW